MNHAEFDWDFENIRHIARHGVSPEEAEDVFVNDPVDLGDEYIEGEWRFNSLGFTRSGRMLIVVATMRRERIRVVTSFVPSAKLIHEFLEQGSDLTMLKVPKFETERAEADWWYDNRDLLEEEFLKAIKSGVRPGPSRALRRLAEIRGVTLEEIQATLRAHSSDPAELTSLPKLPRSA